MQQLLEAVAGPLAGEEQETAFVAGMRLVAVDGMCLDVPATGENGAEFGYPGNDAGPGPFPQVRVVGLGECGTRAVLGAELSPLAAGEQPLALKLLPRLGRGDLLLADRNFLSHGLLAEVLAAGVHVLWRAKSDIDLPVLDVLPDGTYLSRIADPAASRRMRRKGADPRDIPGIPVRVIEYSVTSAGGTEISETFTLVTDITDPAPLTAEQAAPASATPDAFPPRLLDELAAGLAAEITWHRHLVPARPGRRYERTTKRPGGRYKTRKHGEATRLTPLTKVVFWLMPVPA